jgi:predicted MPP superfamily phosphohydrolase
MIAAWIILSVLSAYVAYDWAVGTFAFLSTRRRALAVALGIPCFAPPILGHLVVHEHSRIAAGLQAVLAAVIVTLAVSAVPMALLRLAGRAAARWATRRGPPQPESGPRRVPMTRRQAVEGAAGIALFTGTGSMVGWGIVRGRHAFELREIAVKIPGLPRVLDGYVIAHVSDIHIGPYVGDRELGEGLELVSRARPDLVAVTGDIVDFEPELAGMVARRLVEVSGRDGVAAVLGNHDYYAGRDRVLRGLQSAGVDTLVNRGRVLRGADGGGLALLGVDDKASPHYGAPGPRLDLALAAVPPHLPRILLSHQPPTVDAWAGQVALQLSGHTHGGQINPGRLVNPFFEYVAGPYSVAGTLLYVNRGFGTVGPPARVGSPPEVTRIVLVAA